MVGFYKASLFSSAKWGKSTAASEGREALW